VSDAYLTSYPPVYRLLVVRKYLGQGGGPTPATYDAKLHEA
jgi:hypothetical protein